MRRPQAALDQLDRLPAETDGLPPATCLRQQAASESGTCARMDLSQPFCQDVPATVVEFRLQCLVDAGRWPEDAAGAWTPLRLGNRIVGAWLRTGAGRRPLAVHMAWRTELETALTVVRAAARERRTPEPLRLARQAAREAREALA